METIKGPGLIEVLIPLLVIVFIIAVGVVLLYQHFQKNLYIHQLRQETMKRDHQNELLRANIQAQEEERRRIANDLHDELGAMLSLMRMNMIMLERQSAETGGGQPAGIKNVRELAESALASMRSISHRLMPPQLERFGLVKTLDAVITQINDTGGLQIDMRAAGCVADAPWAVSLGLYRIVMELINNTMRHSGATQAGIDIDEKDGYIVCHYTDNGKGLPEDNSAKGLGLKSVEGRVNAMKGTLEFGTAPAGGFYAVVNAPLYTGNKTAQ